MFKTFTGGSSGAAPVAGNASGTTSVTAPGGWHPTILYLAGLLVFEVLAVGFLLRFVK